MEGRVGTIHCCGNESCGFDFARHILDQGGRFAICGYVFDRGFNCYDDCGVSCCLCDSCRDRCGSRYGQIIAFSQLYL
jgi:hypothetical protein